MVTKTITIMEDAYELLAQNKRKEESFSEVIRRLAKKDIMQFAGAWKMSKKEAEELKKGIRDDRLRETKKLLEEFG